MEERTTVAIIYDFDKTLSPRNMQEYSFIPGIGMESNDFWEESKKLAKDNKMDKILAYMYLMVKKSREMNKKIDRESFVNAGRNVELFEGVDTWFDRVNKYGAANDIIVNHYIISSGLKEIIEGTSIAQNFKAIFASEFYYGNNGAEWPAIALNFTSKTQFLFRINKNVPDITDDEKLNRYVPENKRPVPFSHMIYIGDGITDVPCMKLVKVNGGHSVAVYQNGDKKTIRELLEDGRVDFIAPASYEAGSKIEQYTRKIIDKIHIDTEIERHFSY
jgi:hypothetical protein